MKALPLRPAEIIGQRHRLQGQLERILGFTDSTKREGARLPCRGGCPSDPALADGFFVEPTVFVDVEHAH